MNSYYYIDTSAYLGVLLGEEGASPLVKLIQNKMLCSSVLMFAEAERNLVNLSREKMISKVHYELCLQRLKEDVDFFSLKELDLEISLNRVYPALKTPRTLDLIHLRTAMWFQNKNMLEAFVTLDKHQCSAASELNLPLLRLN